LQRAAPTDGDEPPALANGRKRLSSRTVNVTIHWSGTARPTFTLCQVDDLIVLRVQHGFLLTTVLHTHTHLIRCTSSSSSSSAAAAADSRVLAKSIMDGLYVPGRLRYRVNTKQN